MLSRRGLDPGDAAFAAPSDAVTHRQCRLHVRRYRLSAVRRLFGVEIRTARAVDCAAARAQAYGVGVTYAAPRATKTDAALRSIRWSRRCRCAWTIRRTSPRKSGGQWPRARQRLCPGRSGCSFCSETAAEARRPRYCRADGRPAGPGLSRRTLRGRQARAAADRCRPNPQGAGCCQSPEGKRLAMRPESQGPRLRAASKTEVMA